METEQKRFYRKILKIRAIDSPNVRYALEQIKAGIEPDNRILVPGLLSWGDYQKRRATWNIQRQTIGLDAEFWEGEDTMLYPAHWISRANLIHIKLLQRFKQKFRRGKSMGIDTAEGGDKTCWAIGDEYGLIDLISRKTPNTAKIARITIGLAKKYKVKSSRWIFDRGGGGKVHADYLRERGYFPLTVGFGESPTPPPQKGKLFKPFEEKIDDREERYQYLNRRAELYGEFSLLLDPNYERGFGIPLPADFKDDPFTELVNQMSVIPRLTDEEGRLWMLPKKKKKREDKKPTLIELIGHSPDELDAVVLMVHGLTKTVKEMHAGVAF